MDNHNPFWASGSGGDLMVRDNFIVQMLSEKCSTHALKVGIVLLAIAQSYKFQKQIASLDYLSLWVPIHILLPTHD
jgi:hypothetical protein